MAWDDVNEVMYIHEFGTGRVFRYCVNNTPSWCTGKQGAWSALPTYPIMRQSARWLIIPRSTTGTFCSMAAMLVAVQVAVDCSALARLLALGPQPMRAPFI